MSEKSLRSKLIRLAHQKPELREHLLPLVTKSAGFRELKESDSYDVMEQWVTDAIKEHNRGNLDLEDLLFPLTAYLQDVHSAIEWIAGSKSRGGVGMSARKLLKWYDEN